MKKTILYSLISFIVFFAILMHVYKNHIVLFSYIHPHTNTQSFKHIAKTIKILDKAFDSAKISLSNENIKIKYLYENAYGSGFIKNNPIPNDLDFAIGIDLGDFEYTGNNKVELANKIVDAMNAYQLALVFYVDGHSNGTIVSKETPLDYFDKLITVSKINKTAIVKTLDLAIDNKSYILHTKKGANGNYNENGVDVPFIMEPGEILLEDRRIIKFFSNTVAYNDNSLNYMREVSVIPEYFATIKYNGKKYKIIFATEAFLGGRIKLAERMYVPQAFINLNSINYLKKTDLINNNNKYNFYRLFSFKHLLQEMDKNFSTNKPIKTLKRLLQTTDIIYPLLKNEDKKEIYDFVTACLNNDSIKILNNYLNICANLKEFASRPKLFFDLQQVGEIQKMLNYLEESLVDLSKNKEINEDDLRILSDFYNLKLKRLLEIRKENDLENIKPTVFDESYKLTLDTLNTMISNTHPYNPKTVSKYSNIFNKILSEAGFHKVSLCWLNSNILGIISDDFTKTIKDIGDFVKKNELIDLNYKLIQPSQAPAIAMHYDVFARYNSTQKEEETYKKLVKTLLDDKKNFNIKTKIIFIR